MNQSRFLPTVDLSGRVLNYISAGHLTFQRGQWVAMNGAKGRWLGVDREIVWRLRGETFRSFNLRFKVALMKALRKVARRVRQVVNQLAFTFEVSNAKATVSASIPVSSPAHGRALFRRRIDLLSRGAIAGRSNRQASAVIAGQASRTRH